jgi:hypothetical protein
VTSWEVLCGQLRSPHCANRFSAWLSRFRAERAENTSTMNGQTCANTSDQPCSLTPAVSHSQVRQGRFVGQNGVASTYSMERDLPSGRAVNELEVVASEPLREFAIRTTAGPTPFLYRYWFSPENGETVVTLDAEVEMPGPAALLPQLARRLVKKGVNDNLATLKRILEVSRP